jgi:hypothetical protein
MNRISWGTVLLLVLGSVWLSPASPARANTIDCISVSGAGANFSGTTYSLTLNNSCNRSLGSVSVRYIFSSGSSGFNSQEVGSASVFSSSSLTFNISSLSPGTYSPDILITTQDDYSSKRVFLSSYTKRSTGGSGGGSGTYTPPVPVRPTSPYCRQVTQPSPSGKQISPTEATFTWSAVPGISEYKVSTSSNMAGAGWSAWDAWKSVGNVTAVTAPVTSGQTLAFNVIANCTADGTQVLGAGNAYVDYSTPTVTAPSVPTGWYCQATTAPTITCQSSKTFTKKESKTMKAAEVIRNHLGAANLSLQNLGTVPLAPPKVIAKRDSMKRIAIDIVASFSQKVNPYPAGRFTPRS